MAHPEWFPDPRVPEPDECALGLVLRRRAITDPTGSFAVFADGVEWSNRAAFDGADATRRSLAGHGVGEGDRVAILLPNGAAFIRCYLGATLLGALPVPIHTAMRGPLLKNALMLAKARVIVTHSTFSDAIVQCWPDMAASVVEIDRDPDFRFEPGPEGSDLTTLNGDVGEAPAAWTLAALLFTSGTTGGTKAVRVRNGQLWSVARAHFGFLRPEDRVMITTPLCHIGPLSAFAAAMTHGASMAIVESFKTDRFWTDLGRYGATVIPGLGPSLLHFLNSAPPTPQDAHNALRVVNVTAVGEEARRFSKRFGVGVFASFGMTEISVALISEVNSDRDGTCGRPRDGIEVRIVNDRDLEAPRGTVGEITLRAHNPWVLSEGYEDNAEATVAAWRNGWFHTGDLGRQDEDGHVYFADRLKDVIRRRGENISSMEVERETRAHPHVREAAALGVDSEHGDQDVLLVVSALPGSPLDPAALHAFLVERLPHFMTPRFIRVMDDLPKTASAKVIKARLREDGLVPGTWDRVARGDKARPGAG